MPGWTATVERAKLTTPLKVHGEDVTEAVSKITWTAAAGSDVKPGEFQEFEVSAGPMPEVDRIVFKALQTYSNNEVVRWIEEPAAAGGEEPEHPAPVLKLAKAAAPATTSSPGAGAPNANVNLASETDDSSDGGNGLATTAGIAGLVAGLAGLVFGILAWRRAGAGTPAS